MTTNELTYSELWLIKRYRALTIAGQVIVKQAAQLALYRDAHEHDINANAAINDYIDIKLSEVMSE